MNSSHHRRIVNFKQTRLDCDYLVRNQLTVWPCDDDLHGSVASITQLNCARSETINLCPHWQISILVMSQFNGETLIHVHHYEKYKCFILNQSTSYKICHLTQNMSALCLSNTNNAIVAMNITRCLLTVEGRIDTTFATLLDVGNMYLRCIPHLNWERTVR